jgi:hypothetical protein
MLPARLRDTPIIVGTSAAGGGGQRFVLDDVMFWRCSLNYREAGGVSPLPPPNLVKDKTLKNNENSSKRD